MRGAGCPHTAPFHRAWGCTDLPAEYRDTKGWPVTDSGYVEAESANDKAVLESPWVAAVAEGEGVPSASSPGAISGRPRPTAL
jgi:hypothetical protein